MAIFILFIAAAIGMFLKKSVSENIWSVVILLIGTVCFMQASIWWSIGFIIFVGLCCSTENKAYADTSRPLYTWMAISMVIVIGINLLLGRLFGINPFWFETIAALWCALVYVLNAKK